MDLLLDSNVFKNREVLSLFRHISTNNLFINPVIDLEQRFYFLLKRKVQLWNTILKELKIQILPLNQFDSKLAALNAQNFINDPRGPSYHFRDCLIGATLIRYGLNLVTNNVKDFQYIPNKNILSVNDVIHILQSN